MPEKFRSNHRRCSAKPATLLERGSSIAKFSRPILKNILERLPLKISISQDSQEITCARVSLLIKLQVWDSGTGVFLWICEISKNTFFHITPLVVASANLPKEGNIWFFIHLNSYEYLKFCYDGMVLSCNIFFQVLSDTVFFLSYKHNIFTKKKF